MKAQVKDIRNRSVAILEALRDNLGGPLFYPDDVREFNTVISDLLESGLDMNFCFVQNNEFKPESSSHNVLSGKTSYTDPCIDRNRYLSKIQAALKYLESLPEEESLPSGSADVVQLCGRFGQCARQLTKRHDDRPPFVINDEYDAQDLLHAILRLRFDDVRAEEPVPSFASKSSRTDFYLPEIKTFIEVKYFGQKRAEKKVRSEIIEDVASYSSHHGCETLIVLIYEGDKHIGNPTGFISDLEKLEMKGRPIRVIIAS